MGIAGQWQKSATFHLNALFVRKSDSEQKNVKNDFIIVEAVKF